MRHSRRSAPGHIRFGQHRCDLVGAEEPHALAEAPASGSGNGLADVPAVGRQRPRDGHLGAVQPLRLPRHEPRPDGKRVYVSSGGEGTVQVIDTANNAIVAAIPVGKRPWNMAITPDGSKLYVACGRSNAVAVIDTATNAKIADIAVGALPWGVALR